MVNILRNRLQVLKVGHVFSILLTFFCQRSDPCPAQVLKQQKVHKSVKSDVKISATQTH